MRSRPFSFLWQLLVTFLTLPTLVLADERAEILDVPDYGWASGCMGTATGNLAGYWDRNGFPGMYTGPLNGGVAPLSNIGSFEDTAAARTNSIAHLWASPAHLTDYYKQYQDSSDSFSILGSDEHDPDCIGDFIGLSQMKWKNMAGECDGNLDGYTFVFWETNGTRRINYEPVDQNGTPVPDVPSGLRAWTQSRQYDASVFSQLADINISKPFDRGFSFQDLRNQIDSGYPLLLFLQNNTNYYRIISGKRVNPPIHAYLAVGYYVDNLAREFVLFRDSWGTTSVRSLHQWTNTTTWTPGLPDYLPLRGVIGFHPRPKLISSDRTSDGNLELRWHGPASNVYFKHLASTNRVHGYVVEMAGASASEQFVPVSSVLLTNRFTVTNPPSSAAYFRVKLVKPEPGSSG